MPMAISFPWSAHLQLKNVIAVSHTDAAIRLNNARVWAARFRGALANLFPLWYLSRGRRDGRAS